MIRLMTRLDRVHHDFNEITMRLEDSCAVAFISCLFLVKVTGQRSNCLPSDNSKQ